MAAEVSKRSGGWERLAPLTGVLAVVLWLIGILVTEAGNTPDDDDATGADFVRYFENEEGSLYAGSALFFLGSLVFIWWAGKVRASLGSVEGDVARRATVVFGAAVATSVLSMCLFAPQISGAFAANESDTPLAPAAAQALWYAGDGFFVATEYAAALFLVAAAVAIFRTRLLPVWLAWVGIVFAVVLLIPPIGWAALIFGFPIWVLAASFFLWDRQGRRASPPLEERPLA